MKLYTEEEVIELMYWISPVYMDREDIKIFLKNKSTPIELPSDEEIEQRVTTLFGDVGMYQLYDKDRFIDGAKWMKEQILNQKK